jgi:hypothetical protein
LRLESGEVIAIQEMIFLDLQIEPFCYRGLSACVTVANQKVVHPM